MVDSIAFGYLYTNVIPHPHEDAGGLSREYVLRIPSVSLKATKWDGLSESPYQKRGPVSV